MTDVPRGNTRRERGKIWETMLLKNDIKMYFPLIPDLQSILYLE